MVEASASFLIPWACLQEQRVFPIKKIICYPSTKKTLVQDLCNTYDIPMSQLRILCIKGDMVFVRLVEEDYLTGLEDCKNDLHGRII